MPYWGIGTKEFLGAFFFIVGYYYRHSQLRFEYKYLLIPLGCIIVAIGTEFWQASMLSVTRMTLLPYTATALVGIMCVFAWSHYISTSNVGFKYLLLYVGERTLTILTWHFLCFKIISLVIIFLYNLPIQRLAEFPVIEEYASRGWWIAYLLIGVVFPLMIDYILGYTFKVGKRPKMTSCEKSC